MRLSWPAGLPVRCSAAAALLVLGSCWVPVSTGHELDARITRLEKAETARQPVFEEEVRKTDSAISRVQAKLDEIDRSRIRVSQGLLDQAESLEKQIQVLRSEIDAQSGQIAQLSVSLQALTDDTAGRFAALQGEGALEEWEAHKKMAAMTLPSGADGLLTAGRAQEAAGEDLVALEIYRQMVQRFPTNPDAALARFRMGEIEFSTHRWREAIMDYRTLEEDFPRNELIPDALYRTGEVLLKLDLRADARATFEQVLRRFPESSAAIRARERLRWLPSYRVSAREGKQNGSGNLSHRSRR